MMSVLNSFINLIHNYFILSYASLKSKGVRYLIAFCCLTQCSDDESSIHITSVDPIIGCLGDTMAIEGLGFSEIASNNIVKFNGVQGEVILAYSNLLGVRIPDNASSGRITIQIGSEIVTGPTYIIAGPQYYVKFKADGQSKIFEACRPGYESTTICGMGQVPFAQQDTDPHAGISVCNPEIDKVTAAVMESWNGDKFLFMGEYPVAHFEFYENQIKFSSYNADSQTDSELIITDVTREPVDEDNQIAYKVKGTFKCNVATDTGEDIAITNGEFVVRFTEYDL
jgi:hypothetical protein